MIPAAIAWESALSEPNAAFRGDSDRSGSPKEGIGEIPAREETATAIPGRYSDELLDGSVNAFLTLRVGMITKRYCGSLVVVNGTECRRAATVEAAKSLQGVVSETGPKIFR